MAGMTVGMFKEKLRRRLGLNLTQTLHVLPKLAKATSWDELAVVFKEQVKQNQELIAEAARATSGQEKAQKKAASERAMKEGVVDENATLLATNQDLETALHTSKTKAAECLERAQAAEASNERLRTAATEAADKAVLLGSELESTKASRDLLAWKLGILAGLKYADLIQPADGNFVDAAEDAAALRLAEARRAAAKKGNRPPRPNPTQDAQG